MLSIVVPVRGSPDLLAQQLQALADQRASGQWEVVVADDSDPGETEITELLKEFEGRLPGLKRVQVGGRGAAAARNAGAAAASGDKLGFLDADDVAAPGWVEAMSAALDRHSVVASRWEFELLNSPEVRFARAPAQVTGPQAYKWPHYLDHAGGCGLGVTREAFDTVGGFDESWRLLEDTDLSWRLQLAGYDLSFAPDAVVHIRFRSGAANFWQAYGYGIYNARLYKEYRLHGMPRLTPGDSLRSWSRLLRNVPDLLHPQGRNRFLRNLGFRVGRLIGSVRFRVWAA